MERNQRAKALTQEAKRLKKQLKSSKVRRKRGRLVRQEKCPLTPAHQRRRPGRDKDVAGLQCIPPADRDFLNGLNPQPDWWREALRRGASSKR